MGLGEPLLVALPAIELFVGGIAVTASGVLGSLLVSPVVLCIFLFIVTLILDTGGGLPLLWPILSLFFRPFRPTPAYQRLKSKFLVRS